MTKWSPKTGGSEPSKRERKPPLWRRRWFVVSGGFLLLLLIIGALSDPEQQADDRAGRSRDAVATPTSSPTPDAAGRARAEAAALVDERAYMAAVDALEDAGLKDAADRVRQRGTRALVAAARRALERGRYEIAKANALDARLLRRTSPVRAVLADANAGIARVRAEAGERRRQARTARDLRSCTSREKETVRSATGTPPGCTTYAAELDARRQAEQEEQPADADCAPGYDPCVPPYPPDLNCPDVGPVTVTGPDPHGLDADGDGVACGGD